MATGMVTAGISVARSEPRKGKITASTMSSATPSAFSTSFIDSRMNTEKSIFTVNADVVGQTRLQALKSRH